MIWQFDNSQIYVLGSVHVMREDDNNHIKSINYTYEKVTNVVFETSLDFGNIPIARYENDKLAKNISKTLFRDVKQTWLKYGLQYSDLDQSKIWHAANSIIFSIFNNIGFSSENGIDRIIWNKSQQDNKKVEWLESQTAGLSCLDNSPIEEQQKILTKAVRNKSKIIEEITEITESWNAANEERLLKVLQICLDELPTMFNCLIIERNSLWVNKFVDSLNSGAPTLFVVGALHCVGGCSILNMLHEKHGCSSKLINA